MNIKRTAEEAVFVEVRDSWICNLNPERLKSYKQQPSRSDRPFDLQLKPRVAKKLNNTREVDLVTNS